MILKAPLSFPNLHFQQLRKICHTKPAILAKQYGLEEFDTPKGKYWFKDNGADILGVAHVDSVLPFLHFEVARLRPDTLIYCSTLDNRLGVYIILDWLDKSGAKYDLLLTDNEEKGESTAKYFKPPKDKKYNWTFSFDRKGEDVATYQYYSVGFAQAIMRHGAESVVHGTYSDIVELEHLGCRGLNFGIGFHNEHNQFAYAHKSEILGGLRRFQSFYREYASIAFPFETEKSLTSANIKYMKRDSAKEHRVLVGKTTEQLKKEFKERRRAAEETNRPNIKAMETLLQQNISILHLSPGTISTLYENDIYLVKDLVKHSRVKLLGHDGVTKVMIEEIEKILPPLGLSFAMSLQAYHLPIVSMRIVKKEDIDPSGKVHHNIILALPTVQKAGKVYGGISLTPGKKSLVSHPKAPFLSTQRIRGSEDATEYIQCPNCSIIVNKSQIDKESKTCETCAKERKMAGLDSAFPDGNCLGCGNVHRLDDLDDNLKCIECLEKEELASKTKVKTSTEDKGATVMRAAFKLNRDYRDNLTFALTKDGFQWVSISPLDKEKKIPVGFR